MKVDDGDDSKLPRHSHRKRNHNNSNSWFPSSIVCKDTSRYGNANVVEWGLVLSLGILGLFAVGCYETITALPEPPRVPTFGAVIHPTVSSSSSSEPRVLSSSASHPASKTSSSLHDPQSRQQPRTNHHSPEQQQQQQIHIPPSIWPVSTRNETEFDTILHPGDGTTKMQVPKFWSLPVHHNALMSRATALSMGSCLDPTRHGSDCPVHQRTIFVAIASYRDFQCRMTVESIFSRAAHPERIRVAIVDQVTVEDPLCNEPPHGDCSLNPDQTMCKYKDTQVDVFRMEASLSIGPVFARHIGYRQYRGEYYATQSDAHVSYTQNWDTDIIEQWMATNNVRVYTTSTGSIAIIIVSSQQPSHPSLCIGNGGPLHVPHGCAREYQ